MSSSRATAAIAHVLHGERRLALAAVFRVTMTMPVGAVGKMKEEVEFMMRSAPLTADAAREMARVFIVPEDLGTPTGAVTLRGAANFRLPEGWDTVYTSVLDNVERPMAPILVVRVETDWYTHDSEFRYVLQPGESIPGARNMPIGQESSSCRANL